MNRSSRFWLVASSVAAIALIAAACGTGVPSASPSASSAAPTVAPTVSPTPSATPVASPTPTPVPTPAPSSSAGAACPVTPSDGLLPSDRFVDLKVASTATADRVTFIFGEPSLGSPAGSARGSLDVAVPPFTNGDMRFEVRGERVVAVTFTGMSIANDVGQEVYQGPPEVVPGLVALRHVVVPGQFEGLISVYVGYDGPGCVELGRDGKNVTLTIQRP